jgi:hypothetical protein
MSSAAAAAVAVAGGVPRSPRGLPLWTPGTPDAFQISQADYKKIRLMGGGRAQTNYARLLDAGQTQKSAYINIEMASESTNPAKMALVTNKAGVEKIQDKLLEFVGLQVDRVDANGDPLLEPIVKPHDDTNKRFINVDLENVDSDNNSVLMIYEWFSTRRTDISLDPDAPKEVSITYNAPRLNLVRAIQEQNVKNVFSTQNPPNKNSLHDFKSLQNLLRPKGVLNPHAVPSPSVLDIESETFIPREAIEKAARNSKKYGDVLGAVHKIMRLRGGYADIVSNLTSGRIDNFQKKPYVQKAPQEGLSNQYLKQRILQGNFPYDPDSPYEAIPFKYQPPKDRDIELKKFPREKLDLRRLKRGEFSCQPLFTDQEIMGFDSMDQGGTQVYRRTSPDGAPIGAGGDIANFLNNVKPMDEITDGERKKFIARQSQSACNKHASNVVSNCKARYAPSIRGVCDYN